MAFFFLALLFKFELTKLFFYKMVKYVAQFYSFRSCSKIIKKRSKNRPRKWADEKKIGLKVYNAWKRFFLFFRKFLRYLEKTREKIYRKNIKIADYKCEFHILDYQIINRLKWMNDDAPFPQINSKLWSVSLVDYFIDVQRHDKKNNKINLK